MKFDNGQVRNGAKCAKNMMCLDSECVPVDTQVREITTNKRQNLVVNDPSTTIFAVIGGKDKSFISLLILFFVVIAGVRISLQLYNIDICLKDLLQCNIMLTK